MSQNIGPSLGQAILGLAVDASGLKSGLSNAQTHILQTIGTIQGHIARMRGKLSTGLADAVSLKGLKAGGRAGLSGLLSGGKFLGRETANHIGAVQDVFAGGLNIAAKGLAGSLAAVGAAGAASMGAFAGATYVAKERLEELSKVAKAGEAFGLSGSQGTGLFGLMASAGSDVRDASEGLVTLGQRVRDALSGTGKEAAELFQGLGVAADQFAGKNPADQFYLLIDALSRVQDPATRVGLLLKAVGEDTGKNLMPLLGKTGEQARQMASGFALTAGELSKMAGASNAVTRMESVFDRLRNKLAVAASPFIESVANAFEGIDIDKVGTKLTKLYDIATDVFERVKAFASDQFEKLGNDLDGWLTRTAPKFKPGTDPKGNPAVSAFARSVADFGKAVGQLLGKTVDNVSGAWSAYSYMFDSVAGSIQGGIGQLVGSRTMMQEGARLDAQALRHLEQSSKDFSDNTGDRWGRAGEQFGLRAGMELSAIADKALTPKLKFADAAMDGALAAAEAAITTLPTAIANAVDQKLPEKLSQSSTASTAIRAGTSDELSFRLKAMSPVNDQLKEQLLETRRISESTRRTAEATFSMSQALKNAKIAN